MKIITKTEYEKSFKDLKGLAENGTLKSGDIIPIQLKNGEQIELEVGHDESGKTFFVFKDCLTIQKQMNDKLTNEGGWEKTELRKIVNNEILSFLPDELREVIAPTTIVRVRKGKRHEMQDKLFCLSETQVFGKSCFCKEDQEPEDSQIDIFKDFRGRIKNRLGSSNFWWLRSPCCSFDFRLVIIDGGKYNITASNSYGVVLAFCL